MQTIPKSLDFEWYFDFM